MATSSILRKLVHALDNHGLPGLVRRVVHRSPTPQTTTSESTDTPHPFDLLHQTDTGGYIPGQHLASGSKSDFYNTAYYAISPSTLRLALQHLPTCQATFIDLGCGKGRALLVAAEFPFPRILGVELSPMLAATALRNAQSYPQIQIHQNDATIFPFPESPLVLFLYHPFLAPVLRRTLRNLQRQLALSPRPVWLLMANPSYPKVFAAFPFLKPIWETTFPLSAEDAAADRHGTTSERYILYQAQL